MDKIRSVLEGYLPQGAAETMAEWIVEYRIHLHIKRDRRTKAGDYRAPTAQDPKHRISINYNLNPYAFLITLVHEIAHRTAFEKYSRNISPHGKEWKMEIHRLMQPFLAGNVFPEEIKGALIKYLKNPAASTGGDKQLAKLLHQYDPEKPDEILLENLPEDTLFNLGDKRVFRKGALRRTRYLCFCLTNKRNYLVDGIAQVYPIEE
jgi:SprT protein